MNRKTLSVFSSTIFLFCLTLPILPVGVAENSEGAAEVFYQQFREIYVAESTVAAMEQCLELLEQAYALAPDVYKYSFARGAVFEALERHDDAYRWYNEAESLAQTEKQRLDANVAARENLFLTVQFSASDPAPEVRVDFVLKGGSFEPDRMDFSELPTLYPAGITEFEKPVYLQELFAAQSNWYDERFFIVSYESSKTAEEHFRDGISDFYNYFRRYLFPELNHERFLMLLGDDPYGLMQFTEVIYPDVEYYSRAPFMGYYNRRDNLLLATVYGGYGTLLHEMLHAMVYWDFPDAPGWIEESLATLYERSRWDSGRLVPLPNWRLDNANVDDFRQLDYFDRFKGNPQLDYRDLSALRLLFIYLDAQGKLKTLYEDVKASAGDQELGPVLAALDLDQEDWSDYLTRAELSYSLEVSSASGARTNPAEVLFVQRAINSIMDAGLDEDGFWGPSTERAVRDFQAARNIEVDGVVGPNTRASLQEEFSRVVINQIP